MEILKQISNDFDVSFDTLLKDDKIYIETIDKGMKKLALWKKLLIFLVVAFVSLTILFFAFLHIAFRGTADGDRIKSDTNARMLVSTEDSDSSKAITRTYDAEVFEGYPATKKTKLHSSTVGRLEGDALIYSDDAEKTRLAVWFCIFEVKYSIGDKEYISLTSVTL